ncbi:MAG: hypothetical protein KF760_29790 [Candidatus Eremiobacteraeota bacterium]|nr:hypothetical protein [Candidatus Eremiobacteraeota bacterium]MCW5866925.1 hypothetical protein [Candidatus Eremiobacteraeota bacterium]
MSDLVLPGFDKWCRISGGLSNAQIARALGVSEARVAGWRAGEGLADPSASLAGLRTALIAIWPPATAEQAWQELLAVIAGARPAGEVAPRAQVEVLPTRATPVRPKAAAKAAPNPELAALLERMERHLEEAQRAATQAEQVQIGWFTRTLERQKKYASGRDRKHIKAFLEFCGQRGQATLSKNVARRDALVAAMEALLQDVTAFERMDDQCTERMQRNRDENVPLWRELKAARPNVALARQAWTRFQSKSLAGIEEVVARGASLLADWQAKFEAISEPQGVSLSWLHRDSKVGQRLLAQGALSQDADPFEGLVVCKDKLADSYKVSTGGSKGVEIDLCAEIDLTIIGPEGRRQAASALLARP